MLSLNAVQRTAEMTRGAGFAAQKWFPRIGPAEGETGLRRSIDLLRTLRTTLGVDAEIMIDAGGSGWNLAYATAWSERAADMHPAWLEEPFSPDQFTAYRALSRRSSIPLAAGEHIYDRAELAQYLESGVLAVAQCDPEWCGGVTELVRMCAVASTFGVAVMPHGHGLHAALHVVASQPEAACPRGEYLVNVMPDRHHFEVNPPTSVSGRVAMTTAPGFGIELDPTKIETRSVTSAQSP